MLLVLVFGASLLVQAVVAAPAYNSQPQPQTLNYEFDTSNMPNSYKFHYDTSDGSSRSEQGAILNPGTKEAALDVNGAVRWYNSNGNLYEMIYKAGKRGYRTIIRRVRT